MDRASRRSQRDDNRAGIMMKGRDRQADQPTWSRAWPNNYGYQRSTEVHLRNAERKAIHDQEKLLRAEARRDGRRFDDRAYRRSVYDYERREAWRDNILRNVISNVFVNNYDNSYYYYNPPVQYVSYYDYGVPYNPYYYA